jgi:F-type H+-transporting ATPase subunit gamma
VIAGDRGLAGGYNSNVFKLLEAKMKQDNVPSCVIPVGKRAVEYCKKRGMEILTEKYAIVEGITPADCADAAQYLAQEFMNGTFDQLQVVYTLFKSMLSQTPTVIQVLPIPTEEPAEKKAGPSSVTLYEPSPEEVFDAIVPEYISGTVYGAISQSWTSELASRSNAMDSATKNASDMIDDLSLKYNRARQGAITQEITEIVAGAEH